MGLYRDEGVILKTVKLGEADRIITMLTRNHGKVRAVAKGVRRTKSRFGARLEPFMRADMLLAQGRNLDVVSQAVSLAAYAASISADYEAYESANVIVETVDHIVTAEREGTPSQYVLLVAALHALAEHQHDPEAIACSYVLRSLALAGWTPRLASCVVCGRADDLGYFSEPAGGVMCVNDHTPGSRHLEPGDLEQLRALAAGDWHHLDGSRLSGEVTRDVAGWAEFYLERPIHSMRLAKLE